MNDGLTPAAGSKPTDPFISVSCSSLAEEHPLTGQFSEDDVIYPVLIECLERSPGSTTRARFLHWRQRTERAFDGHDPRQWDNRIPEVYAVNVKSLPIVDSDATAQNKLRFAPMVALFVARKYRFDGAYWPEPA